MNEEHENSTTQMALLARAVGNIHEVITFLDAVSEQLDEDPNLPIHMNSLIMSVWMTLTVNLVFRITDDTQQEFLDVLIERLQKDVPEAVAEITDEVAEQETKGRKYDA